MKRITANIGFITNSSSCVFYFPPEVLKDPSVAAFLDAYGLGKGFVGSNIWNREYCESFLVTKEQKRLAKDLLGDNDWGASSADLVDENNDGVYVIFGDEYNTATHVLCGLLQKAWAKLNGETDSHYAGHVGDFN